MGYDMKNEHIVFKSGRRLYSNMGMIGIDDFLEVGGGCDNYIYTFPYKYHDGTINELIGDFIRVGDLHEEDAEELSDIMIERWIRFKENKGRIKIPINGKEGI